MEVAIGVASGGGVFTFGNASFHGSMGGTHLNKPVVGMVGTKDGGGYWLVASDGGISSFVDAPFQGSTGAIKLNAPTVGMAPTVRPMVTGCWDRTGVFSEGAPFYGAQ
jgi:hypothetical protein